MAGRCGRPVGVRAIYLVVAATKLADSMCMRGSSVNVVYIFCVDGVHVTGEANGRSAARRLKRIKVRPCGVADLVGRPPSCEQPIKSDVNCVLRLEAEPGCRGQL